MNKIYELFNKLSFYRWDYAFELFIIVAIIMFILTA